MIVVHNHLGSIEFSKAFFVSLIGNTVKSCFGVAALNASGAAEAVADKFPLFGKMFDIDKGIKVKLSHGKVYIVIHISVMYGVNISAAVQSIKNKISYAVEEQTNFPVEKIDVYIDGLTT